MRSISKSNVKTFPICRCFFPISNFAIKEEMASGKVLIQDGKEISLLKSGAGKKNSQGLQTHKTIFQFSEGDISLWSLCSLLSPSQFCSTHWSVAETKGQTFDYVATLCRVYRQVAVGLVQPLSHMSTLFSCISI